MPRFPSSRCLFVGVLATASLLSSPVRAESLVADIAALKRAFAGLLAGTYRADACAPIPNRDGEPARSGALRVGTDGSLSAGPVQLNVFDPAGEFALSKDYSAGGHTSAATLFNYQFRANGRMFDLSVDDKGPAQGFVETGFSGEQRNVSDAGVSCAQTDVRAMPALRAGTALHDFIVAAFTTEGRTVTGRCRPVRLPKGKRPAEVERSGSFSMTAAGVTIDGRMLRFDDALNPVVSQGLGSRFADGTLNGDIVWKDGSGVHWERVISPGVRFATFAFHGPGRSPDEAWHCLAR